VKVGDPVPVAGQGNAGVGHFRRLPISEHKKASIYGLFSRPN
jgi:hypothetical protein